MTTLTRHQLLEALAAAETNLAIATFEETREWTSYNFVVDEKAEGRTTQDVVETYGARAERCTKNRMDKARRVDEVKVQLLKLPEPLTPLETAALDAAKALERAKLFERAEIFDYNAGQMMRHWGHLDNVAIEVEAMRGGVEIILSHYGYY